MSVPTAIYIESKHAAEHATFPRLGVTDAVLLNIVTEKHTLLTSDLDLYIEATRRGHAVINFIHEIEANR